MSPSGDSLRNYCRSFPGLVGNTTIDWMSTWPKQALRSVARGYISENRKIPDSLKDAINDHVVHVHESLAHYTREFLNILRRPNYITPKHYLVSPDPTFSGTKSQLFCFCFPPRIMLLLTFDCWTRRIRSLPSRLHDTLTVLRKSTKHQHKSIYCGEKLRRPSEMQPRQPKNVKLFWLTSKTVS